MQCIYINPNMFVIFSPNCDGVRVLRPKGEEEADWLALNQLPKRGGGGGLSALVWRPSFRESWREKRGLSAKLGIRQRTKNYEKSKERCLLFFLWEMNVFLLSVNYGRIPPSSTGFGGGSWVWWREGRRRKVAEPKAPPHSSWQKHS